jgi:hypothetical protein
METSVFLNDTLKRPAQFWLRGLAALILLQLCFPYRGQSETPAAADQRVAVPLSDASRPAVVKASLINGGITVKGYDGKEVVVETRSQSSSESGGEAKSGDGKMKRIPIRATGLSVEEENNRVHISVPAMHQSVDLSIMVPVRSSVILRSVNGGDISVAGVDGELDVNNVNGSVTLTNVSGTVVAHALNGRVLVTLNKINREKPMAFSSLNGDIDVTFPPDLKANVTLSTDHGEVFSDFDVQLQKGAQPKVEDSRGRGGKYRVQIDNSVRGTIGGGGPEIKFKNVQGNIYLRKAGK